MRTPWPLRLAAPFLVVGAVPAAYAAPLFNMPCDTPAPLTAADLKNSVARAVFQVVVTTAGGEAQRNGTATLVDSRGYFLTAAHVVEGYAGLDKGNVILRRADGTTLNAKVLANFAKTGVDVAVLKVDDFQPILADPIPLRVSNPATFSPVMTGVVLTYDNQSDAMRNPIDFSVGGYAGDPDVSVNFTAVGGNSGALLLEPNGRAFGLLIQGPKPDDMEIKLFVPETVIPASSGDPVIPEIAITVLPGDIQKSVSAAQKSGALGVSSFWDRLSSAIPPSPSVENALIELKTHGWKNILPAMSSSNGYKMTALDVVHFFRKITENQSALDQTISNIASSFSLAASTCTADAFQQIVIARFHGTVAKIAAANTDKSENGVNARSIAAELLKQNIRLSAAIKGSDPADLAKRMSDLAVLTSNRVALGEAGSDELVTQVAVAEGLGGTPTTGELAGLLAARSGSKEAGAAYMVLANARLREASRAQEPAVVDRRQTIERIFDIYSGHSVFGQPVDEVERQTAERVIKERSDTSVSGSLRAYDGSRAFSVMTSMKF